MSERWLPFKIESKSRENLTTSLVHKIIRYETLTSNEIDSFCLRFQETFSTENLEYLDKILNREVIFTLWQLIPDREQRIQIYQWSSSLPFLDDLYLQHFNSEQAKYSVDYLQMLLNENQTAPALTLTLFYQTLTDTALHSWLTNHGHFTELQPFSKINRVATYLGYLTSNLDTFLQHPNRPELCSLVNPFELQSLLAKVKGESQVLTFLLDNPNFTLYLQESLRHHLNHSDAPWQKRLQTFDDIMATLGRQTTTQNEVSAALLQAWQPSTSEEIAYSEQFPTMTSAEKLAFLSRLRNAINWDTEKQLREQIRQSKSVVSNELIDNSAENALIKYRESELFPLKPFLPTVGYEIEGKMPQGLNLVVYSTLDRYGFHLGTGQQYETSPGPFQHPETAITVFERWVNAGLIDTHEELGMTLHFNLGVKSNILSIPLIKALQATGWAYEPFYSPTQAHLYTPYVFSKARHTSPELTYVEAKEYKVTSVQGFKNLIRHGTWLAAAQKAYELALMECRGLIEENLSDDFSSSDPHKNKVKQPLSTRQIQETSLRSEQKELALIWASFGQTLRAGFSQLNLTHLFLPEAPMSEAKRFAKLFKQVYPNSADGTVDLLNRQTINPFKVELPNQKIVVDDIPFPNLVAFAQWLIISHAKAAKDIISRLEEECESEVYQLWDEYTNSVSSANSENISNNFPDFTARLQAFLSKFGYEKYTQIDIAIQIQLLSELKTMFDEKPNAHVPLQTP